MSMASQPLYQLYLELLDYKPKIWRKIQVMNNIKFSRLGYIIMTLFEMQASHLYEFEIDRMENIKKIIRNSGKNILKYVKI